MNQLQGQPLRILLGSLGIMLLLLLFPLSDSNSLTQVKTWSYPSGYDPHGGYIDRLTFIVYPTEDIIQALLALQSGSVYSYDEQIPHQSVAELEANPAIDVSSESGKVFRQFTLNCQRFPTNLTGFRLALAHALDKHIVINNIRGGFAVPMDNPIPPSFAYWTYEDQMTSHFYTEDIDSANATLDAAHIIDPVGDPNHPHPGYRFYDADMSGNWTLGDKRGDILAPDGLKIEAWGSAGGLVIHAPLALAYGMQKCGLQADVVEVAYNYLIAGLGSGEYNCAAFPLEIDSSGIPTLLYNLFHSEADDNAFFSRFNNSNYDNNCTLFMNAPTRVEARNWSLNCCRILMEEMPMIVCYNDENTHAYCTDVWEGYVNQVGRNRMGGNSYTFEQIRLKESAGGPFGCFPTEYVTVLSEGMDSTNPLFTSSKFSHTIFNLIYSKLRRIDPLDPLTGIAPDLAYNWWSTPTIQSGDIQNGTMYTFQLYENITWHDGSPFTAEDVQYSLMQIHPQGIFADELATIYRVDIPNNSTVEIYSNSSSYMNFITSTSLHILPKHIWSPYESGNFTWQPTTSEDFTGTGSYRWVTRVTGQYIILDHNDNWHFGVDHSIRSPCNGWDPRPLLYLIGIGIIIIVIQVAILSLLLRRRQKKQLQISESLK